MSNPLRDSKTNGAIGRVRRASTVVGGKVAGAAAVTVRGATGLPGNAVKAVGTTAKLGVKGTVGVTKRVATGAGGVVQNITKVTKKKLAKDDDRNAWPARLTSPIIKVEVVVECSDVPRKDSFAEADSFCVLWEVPPGYLGNKKRLNRRAHYPTQQEREIGRTEVARGETNPKFTQTFPLEFRFQEEQTFVIRVYDQDSKYETDVKEHDYLGGSVFTLGQLMGSRGCTIARLLEGDNGIVVIAAEEMIETRETLVSRFSVEDLRNTEKVLESTDPYFKFERLNAADQTWQTVWKSEVVHSQDPTWEVSRLPVLSLCDNASKPNSLKISLWNWNRFSDHDPYGFVETDVKSLVEEAVSGIPLFAVYREKKQLFRKSRKEKAGTFKVLKADVVEVPSFLSYVGGGCKINVTVAIDFSAVNGGVLVEESLHYRRDHWLNDYQVLIHKLGIILETYTKNHHFSMWGFGAKYQGETVPFFSMGENLRGGNGMLHAYDKTCDSPYIEPNAAPQVNGLIQAAAYQAIQEGQDEASYSVLCILTAGGISDVKKSIDTIRTVSEDSPLSIVFVGIGDGDFTSIEALFGSKGLRKHANGVPLSRDVLQFVPFNGYNSNPSKVVGSALAEIPEQFVQYYRNMGIKPKSPLPPEDFKKQIARDKRHKRRNPRRHQTSYRQ